MPRRTTRRWTSLGDERLLDLRFSDLAGLSVEGSPLEPLVQTMWTELDQRGLKLKPHVWVSTEWFSPDGVPGIAAPFYLVHPRLLRLERAMMIEAEGASREECLMILRHEAGHAVQHAWRLQRRDGWRRTFGDPSRPYPTVYRPNPASQRFVQHLRQYYAQAHPHEDFAETFAVWLAPRSQWRRRYADWPALRKLEFVDELMRELRGTAPPVRTRRQVEPLSSNRQTLREHYAAKQAHQASDRPSIPDRDLQRLFAAEPGRRGEPAAAFLRRHRAELRRMVARFTGESQFTLEHVLEDVIGRCMALELRASRDDRRLRVDFALLMTVRTVHFHYSRRNWVAL
ncbi:MAG: putative zinc-binding metallopeptidase [bacterium]